MSQKELEPRAEVKWFSELMEKELKFNDYKGSWKNCSLSYLLIKLDEEVKELREAAFKAVSPDGTRQRRKIAIQEAADVGNLAMMIADTISKLGEFF